MIRNYFALYELVREMSERFTGGYAFECFSQEKDELRLSLFSKSKEGFTIVGRTGETRLALYYTEEIARRRRNSASLMEQINDRELKRICISDYDRIIYFELEGDLQLVFQLFSANTNFFLVQNGIILEAFKKNNELAGKAFVESATVPIIQTIERYVQDEVLFANAIGEISKDALSEKDLQKKLPQILTGFDATLTREVLFRAKEKSPTMTVPLLHEAVSEIFYELVSPAPKVYQGKSNQGGVTYWLSIIEERHRAFESVETFVSINEAMKFYSFKLHQVEHFGKELKALRGQLERLIEKTETQIVALEAQSQKNRAEDYERYGQLLMANLHRLEKGMSEITVENFFDGGSIVISLDEKKSPYQNAEMYFEKAKKSRASAAVSAERLKQARENKAILMTLQSELLEIKDQRAFERWRKANLQVLQKFLLVSKAEAEKQMLFRRFQLAPNVEVWVGKNAKNNDLLTFKYARPNDLWLHARGVSGSHCILKSSKPPTRDEIERAAAIAAYYSSAKGSELAPVICTPKKYVRKPKGAEVGAVVVEREEVLLVKPARWAEAQEE
ncbi:MAG: NFACT RNA binding domain-containing protein [Chloroherpetonaceae bacterium]